MIRDKTEALGLDWVPRVPCGPGGGRADQPVLRLPPQRRWSQGRRQDAHLAGEHNLIVFLQIKKCLS